MFRQHPIRTQLYCAALGLAAFAAAALSAQGGLATPHQMLMGTIVRSSPERLILEVRQAEISLLVMPEAAVTIDGRPATASDLKPGYAADVSAEPLDDGMMLAINISAFSRDSEVGQRDE